MRECHGNLSLAGIRVNWLCGGGSGTMAMNRNTEISLELTRLLNQQTEFFQNSALDESTPEELQVFKQSRERVRQLFAELERLRRAA